MKASHGDRASDPESSSQQVRVEASGLRKFAARLLNETGVQKTDAESIAEVLVEAATVENVIRSAKVALSAECCTLIVVTPPPTVFVGT